MTFKEHRQLVFNSRQDKFMRFMLRFPFVTDMNKGGWLVNPFASSQVLAGICDYRAPGFIAAFIDFVIYHLLESEGSLRNQNLCLQYGMITKEE